VKTSAVFTVLPQPVWGTRPGFSIFTTLTPEADRPGQVLRDFPTARVWPTIIRSSQFTLYLREAGGVKKLGQLVVSPYSGASQAQRIWNDILPDDTAVAPPSPAPLTTARVIGYDFKRMADVVSQVYDPLKSGDTPTTVGQIPGLDWWGTEELLAQLAGRKTADLSDFWDFARYHLPDKAQSERSTLDDVQPDDFDRRFSEIGNYSSLFRYLGLILDAELHLLPGVTLPSRGAVAVKPELDSSSANPIELLLPWSSYETVKDKGVVYAHMADDPTRRRGFYTLDPQRMRLVQYDLDNGVFGLMKAARTEKDTNEGLLAPFNQSDTPPALTSTGFSVYHQQILPDLNDAPVRAAGFGKGFVRHDGEPDTSTPVFTSADTEAGCRVDVYWSRTSKWHSLSERRLSFRSKAGTSLALDAFGPSEGSVSLATSSTIDVNSPTGSQPKTSQRLFGWLGWSLVVKRLGAAVDDAGDPGESAPSPTLRWEVHEKVVPGSLPQLRFGDSYKFRCRSVDIAGNSWPLAAAEALSRGIQHVETAEHRFLRLEPVIAPTILAPDPLTLGETKAVLAVRRGSRVSRRVAHPPSASFDLLEKHGAFDKLSEKEGYRLLELSVQAPVPDTTILRFPYAADPMAKGVSALLEGGGEERELGTVWFKPGLERDEVGGIEILLKAGRFGARVRGRTIVVSLPLGDSRRLRLRSVVAPADRHLLAFDGGGPAPSRSSTPPLDLLLVHPSQRSLAAPRHGNPALLKRSRGDTHVSYVDQGLSAHEPTTSRVTLEAKWTDIFDDPAQPDWTRRDGGGVIAAQDIELDPGEPLAFTAARMFGAASPLLERSRAKMAAPAVGVYKIEPDPANSFDFQDTHSRVITVTPVAHGRHAEFFPTRDATTANSAPPAGVQGEPVQLLVRSTANPRQPGIQYILPTLVQSRARPRRREIVQNTSGWALRIYLSRDWRQGQRLALVFGRGPNAGTMSAIGQEPLVKASTPLARLTLAHIDGPGREGLRLPLDDEYEKTGDPKYSAEVDIVHLEPQLDAEKNLRFAEVIIRAQPRAYLPFVRLVLARYAEDSISGAELSRATVAHWAQPAPNRSVSATRVGDGVYSITVLADAADESRPKSRTRFVAHAEYTEYNDWEEYAWAKVEGSEVELQPISHSSHFAWQARVTTPPWRLFGHRRIVISELLELNPGGCAWDGATSRLVAFDILEV
jgi:hypothetical protein